MWLKTSTIWANTGPVAKAGAQRRGAVEGKLVGDRKPAEGWAAIAEFRGVDPAVEPPCLGLVGGSLDAGHDLTARHPAALK